MNNIHFEKAQAGVDITLIQNFEFFHEYLLKAYAALKVFLPCSSQSYSFLIETEFEHIQPCEIDKNIFINFE